MNTIDKIYKEINEAIKITPKDQDTIVDLKKLKTALFHLVGVVDELRRLEHWCRCGEEKE